MIEENIHHDSRVASPLRNKQGSRFKESRMTVRKNIHRPVHEYPIHELRSVFTGKGGGQTFHKIPQQIPDPRFSGIARENYMTEKIQCS